MENNKEVSEKKQSDIHVVIASSEFKEIIKKAILSGVFEDYEQDGNDGERYFDKLCEDTATDNVIKVLSKHLL
jgi:hypothetical protein